MILQFTGNFGSAVSLDLRQRFGEKAEIECFHFVVPPIEFRLVRNGMALHEWQTGNIDLYDLQHGPTVHDWSRNGHRFLNDRKHRNDVMTCGVLSTGLAMETRGLLGNFVLLVWSRESTCRSH